MHGNNFCMLTLIVRCMIIYIIVLIVFRLMGKRQIGELQPFELVITLIIADLATIPMTDTNIPFAHGVVPLLTLLFIHHLISILANVNIRLRQIISGKPVVVITPKGISYAALKSLSMNMDDLQEALRNSDIVNIAEVAYGIIETNGKLTVVKKAENQEVTLKDLNLTKQESLLPMMLIADGRIVSGNLKLAGLDKKFLLKHMKKVGTNKTSQILTFTINNNGDIYIQPKNGNYITFSVNYKGGDRW